MVFIACCKIAAAFCGQERKVEDFPVLTVKSSSHSLLVMAFLIIPFAHFLRIRLVTSGLEQMDKEFADTMDSISKRSQRKTAFPTITSAA